MAELPADRFVTRSGSSEWQVVRSQSTASEFHGLEIPDPPAPQIWVHEIIRPALVLGSTQRHDQVDLDACEHRGFEVVRRRSGGGAVLLVPGEVVWVDLILPTGGPGWSPDVHRPMVWLGERLAAAFRAAGDSDVAVHDAAMVTTAYSRLVCFDGTGPGELTRSDGSKLVGISQRRTRAAARLQCCWYSSYDPNVLSSLLADGPPVGDLRDVATVDAFRSIAVIDHLVAEMNEDTTS